MEPYRRFLDCSSISYVSSANTYKRFCVVEVVAGQCNMRETKERSVRGLEVLTRHFLSCTAHTLMLHKRSTLQEVAP